MTKITENIPMIKTMVRHSSSDRNFATGKMLSVFCRNHEQSGDWKKAANALYTDVQEVTDDVSNFENEKVTEWKYKNVYSTPSPKKSPVFNWSRCHIKITSENSLKEKLDKTVNQKKSFLDTAREHLANYQESQGIPRTEYTFASLIRVMGEATGRSLLALFCIVVNISPLAQILMYILRFVLDKTINIRKTNDYQQAILQYTILGMQLLCIYVCLVFIFGFIVTPVLQMVIGVLRKMMLYD